MDIVFAYFAGLLTLINPCVLPVLPVVLIGALNASRLGPVALAAGMSLSFTVFGLLVSAFGATIGLTQDVMTQVGAILMVAFGAVLLTPAFASRFELAAAGMASRADRGMNGLDPSGLKGQFVGGALLGAVWSPCIGPTLGGAIALAARGEDLAYAATIMAAFSLGVSTLIVGIGLGAQGAIRARAQALRGLAARSKPLLGAAFIAIGLMLYFQFNHVIEGWLLDLTPVWLQDLSVAL